MMLMPFRVTYRAVGLDRGVTLIHRWSLRLPGGWSIKLHHLINPDLPAGCRHSHPWWFISLVLWGWYEEIVGGVRRRRRGTGNIGFRRRKYTHRVCQVSPRGCWTLVLCGRNSNVWGFINPRGSWIPWRGFVAAAPGERAAWCED